MLQYSLLRPLSTSERLGRVFWLMTSDLLLALFVFTLPLAALGLLGMSLLATSKNPALVVENPGVWLLFVYLILAHTGVLCSGGRILVARGLARVIGLEFKAAKFRSLLKECPLSFAMTTLGLLTVLALCALMPGLGILMWDDLDGDELGLWMIFFGIGGVLGVSYFSARLLLYLPLITLEGRSHELRARHQQLRTSHVGNAMTINLGLLIFLTAVTLGLCIGAVQTLGEFEVNTYTAAWVVAALTWCLLTPLFLYAATVHYLDASVRVDGLDLALQSLEMRGGELTIRPREALAYTPKSHQPEPSLEQITGGAA